MTTFNDIRIGEVVTVDVEALDQIGRVGSLANTGWEIDNGSIVAGDPTTRHTITNVSVANPTHITCSTAHGLVNGDRVHIESVSGVTPDINGEHIVIVLSPTVYTIPVNVTAGGAVTGSSQRRNADIVETMTGPLYRAQLTGRQSGDGLIMFDAVDAFFAAKSATKAFTVLNASSFVFAHILIEDGVLILDIQDGSGPGAIQIPSTPVDSRGVGLGAPAYVVSGWLWADPSGHLTLSNETTATVTVEAASQGDGTLVLQALNSKGGRVSASLPYRVLSTVSPISLRLV